MEPFPLQHLIKLLVQESKESLERLRRMGAFEAQDFDNVVRNALPMLVDFQGVTFKRVEMLSIKQSASCFPAYSLWFALQHHYMHHQRHAK